MTPQSLFTGSGNQITLGACIGRGGEGLVYLVPEMPGVAAKVYTSPPNPNTDLKLRYMSILSNQLPKYAAKTLAWPRDTIHATRMGIAIGFLMALIQESTPLTAYQAPNDRAKKFPNATFTHSLRVARNIADIVDTIHNQGHVIGDINPNNFLLNQKGEVIMIDIDSIQITTNGKTFPCNVGTPTFTAPELLIGNSVSNEPKTITHDHFALATLLFHVLLGGRHPFVGVPLNNEDWLMEDNILNHRYAYGNNANQKGIKPPPLSIPIQTLPQTLQQLFEAAFTPNHANGRPTAHDWVRTIEVEIGNQTECIAETNHAHPNHLTRCPWCELRTSGLKTYSGIPTPPYFLKPTPNTLLTQHKNTPRSTGTSISTDARWLTTINPTGHVHIWDMRTNNRTEAFRTTPDEKPIVAMSPSTRTLAVGRKDGFLEVWSLNEEVWQKMGAKGGFPDGVTAVHFTADGRSVLVGCGNGEIHVVTVSTLLATRVWEGHQDSVTSLSVAPDGRVASASSDHSVIIWSPRGSIIRRIIAHHDWVRGVTFTKDGSKILSCGDDGFVKCWDASNADLVWASEPHGGKYVRSVAVSADGLWVASCGDDGHVCVLDLLDGLVEERFANSGSMESSVFGFDGVRVLVGFSIDGTISAWGTPVRAAVRVLTQFPSAVTSFAVSKAGAIVAVVRGEKRARVLSSPGSPSTFVGSWDDEYFSVAFSPDGRSIALGSANSVQMWDARDFSRLADFPYVGGRVTALAFSACGQFLASGSVDSTVRMWNVKSRKLMKSMAGHSDWVNAVAFSADGRSIASASDDRTVRLWDVASGMMHNLFRGHEDWVKCLAWNPDHKHLATGSSEGSVLVWDTKSGEVVSRFVTEGGWVRGLAFNERGDELASCDERGVVMAFTADGKSRVISKSSGVEALTIAYRKPGELIVGFADGGIKSFLIAGR